VHNSSQLRTISTPVLDIGYEEAGDASGDVVVLLHGFPYDPRSFDGVVPQLVDAGARVIVPYLRGYGPTRFHDAATMRSGQQGAIGQDLLELLDALDVDRALLAGFDWGDRASCIVAALHPDRVSGLVTSGYSIQNIARGADPKSPELERADWYQHYFQHEVGHRALEERRDELIEYLWRTWSPTWHGATAAYPASAHSFANPDFVDVVIHSYRHRFGHTPGELRYDGIEAALAERPPITVPTVILQPDSDGVNIGGPDPTAAALFRGHCETRVLHGIGHNLAQEDPAAFTNAVLAIRARSR